MVSRKYVSDYALDELLDKNGRRRTVGRYIGPYFRFRAEREQLRRVRRELSAAAAVCAAAVLVPLLITPPIIRCWYVMIPLVLAILPVGGLAVCACRTLRAGDKVTREQRDGITRKLELWSATLAGLAALSLLGQVVYAVAHGVRADSIPVLLCAAAMLWAAVRLLQRRGALDMVEVPRDDGRLTPPEEG